MPSAEEFKIKHSPFQILLNGELGSGKTTAATSFPRFYMLCGGRAPDILKNPVNAKNGVNLVHFEMLESETDKELLGLLDVNAKSDNRGSIYGCIAHIKELATAGLIDTLIFDDFTFFSEKVVQYVWTHEKQKSAKTGEENTQGMWGTVGMKLGNLVAARIGILASRFGLNIVYTCHLKREDEDTVLEKALTTNIFPDVAGGYRYKLAGRFGASLYFETKAVTKNEKTEMRHLSYCTPQKAMGTKLQAKNAWGLPPVLDLTGKSLYEELQKVVTGK